MGRGRRSHLFERTGVGDLVSSNGSKHRSAESDTSSAFAERLDNYASALTSSPLGTDAAGDGLAPPSTKGGEAQPQGWASLFVTLLLAFARLRKPLTLSRYRRFPKADR